MHIFLQKIARAATKKPVQKKRFYVFLLFRQKRKRSRAFVYFCRIFKYIFLCLSNGAQIFLRFL